MGLSEDPHKLEGTDVFCMRFIPSKCKMVLENWIVWMLSLFLVEEDRQT